MPSYAVLSHSCGGEGGGWWEQKLRGRGERGGELKGARTWTTTPDAKQQVRSRLAMHAR